MGYGCEALSGQRLGAEMVKFQFAETKGRKTQNYGNREEVPWKQKGSHCSAIDDHEGREIRENEGWVEDEIAAAFQDPEQLTEFYTDSIEQSIDRRISLTFQQGIVCHDKPFYFDADEAKDQFGRNPELTIKSEDGTKYTQKYQAAHPCTLPCLLATAKKDWDDYQAKKAAGLPAKKPKRFVYLRKSSGYDEDNATIPMPIFVNQTDTLIDGKAGEPGKLRTRTLKLINKLAEGRLDPVLFTKKFLKKYQERVESLLKDYSEEARGFVLKKHLVRIKQVRAEIATGDGLFDKLMGIKVSHLSHEASLLREIVFRRRFEIITAGQAMESRIHKRIADVLKRISGNEKELFLQFALLRKASDNLRIALEKLFKKSMAVLEAEYIQNQKAFLKKSKNIPAEEGEPTEEEEQVITKLETDIENFQAKARAFKVQHTKVINKLMRDIRDDVRELTRKDLLYRSCLFKNFRKGLNGWTQQQFADKFKELYEDYPMSQPTVNRLEQRCRHPQKLVYKSPLNQRRKDITLEDAERYAGTLGVELGYFISGLFTTIEPKTN